MSKAKMPKELLVYIFDYEGEKPMYAVATNANEIPEDRDGAVVGNYVLNRTHTFKVKRELK